MRPSANVWNGIRKKIHSSQRRFYQLFIAPGLILLFSVSWLTTESFRTVSLPRKDNRLYEKKSSPLMVYNQQPALKKIKPNNISHEEDHLPSKLSTQANKTSVRFNSPDHPLKSLEYHQITSSPASFIKPKDVSAWSFRPSNLSVTAAKPATPVKWTNNKKSWSYQFYMTPSVSYRRMMGRYILKEGESLPELGNKVRHYPATGMEVGIGIIKPIHNRLSIKGGLQVNFSRYQINGSESGRALVFVSTSPVSGFEATSQMSNTEGNKPKKLMNENVQLSVPIGLDYEIIKSKKISFHAAGTMQPGFTMRASGYMITSNYKNYIQDEKLFRRFNLQSALESYIKIHAGSIDVHAGPQFRYQILSNTMDSYPVKEHLVEYGFKIGLIKHIR